MKLIVISPESADPREPAVLGELFAVGLTDYHLRKPTWTRDQLADFLRALPPIFRRRIVLHSHHDLVAEFSLAGPHHRDQSICHLLSDKSEEAEAVDKQNANPVCNLLSDKKSGGLVSRAVHDLDALESVFFRYDRLFFSPVFPSISKPGHTPAGDLDRERLQRLLTGTPRFAEVIALGGIDDTRIPECKALGFDGVAVLGAVWQAADPVAAFNHLRDIASFA